MGQFDFFGKKAVQDDLNVGEILTHLRTKLVGVEPAEVKYVAALAGLMGRVAFADFHFSDEEKSHVKKVLTETISLPEKEVDALVQLIAEKTKALSGIEDYLYTREIREQKSREERKKIIIALFALAASDDSISTVENEEIRKISRAFQLSPNDFKEVRRMYSEKLAVLKT